MNDAVERMLARYPRASVTETIRALREILQEVALLGLWRSKFFEKAAFYGGTALRILHGLDRFSEGLDFSLLRPAADFDIGRYAGALQREIGAFGFEVRIEKKTKAGSNRIQSAFLKADTLQQFLVIQTADALAGQVPRGHVSP